MKSVMAAACWILCAGLSAETILWQSGDFSGSRGGARVEDGTLVIPRPGGEVHRSFALKPEWRVINLKGSMRVTDVPRTKEGWQTGRFAMEWRDARGRAVQPWPQNFGWTGTTDWKEVDHDYLIPSNATRLVLSLCNLSTGGEVRFRDVSLSVIRNRVSKPENALPPRGAAPDLESLHGAWKAASATRVRYSLNGFWRCRPSLDGEGPDFVPDPQDNWAWAKIPDVWPWQNAAFCASSRLSPWFEDHPTALSRIRPDRAWYGRVFTLPPEAAGRRISMAFDLIATRATVWLNGQRTGIVTFPGGEVDLTPFLRATGPQTLALDVTAFAGGDTLSYNESTRADRKRAVVKFKGVTGDVWLDCAPRGARITDAHVDTSVTKGTACFTAETVGLASGTTCRLTATVHDPDPSAAPRVFTEDGVVAADGTISFTAAWKDAKHWDTHTPENRYTCTLTLADANGQTLDETVPFMFGFREVAIDGRALKLNGTTVHLRALYDSTYNSGGPLAAKTNAVLACRAALAAGFNAMIAGNYSFAAGATPYLQGILDAADETGILYCFTLPHFKDFGALEEPEARARYRETTAKLMRLARNHPSVILWATSHNAAGYLGAGHPQRIDGLYELPASANGTNRRRARICRKIIGELDPSRPCYHHESGNLDDFHCVNCYLDWSPIQERSEWLQHWSEKGVKPLFFVEWGLPHISNWSSYRGPLFIWRKPGYMSLWSAEYAAAYRGDAAYEDTPVSRGALAAEEQLWKKSARGFMWGRLIGWCEAQSNNYNGVQALFASDNWRSLRAWGITAMLPWDQGGLFRRVRDVNTVRLTAADVKKAPGYVPSSVSPPWGDARAYDPTALGHVFLRWNGADCAWIGGAGNFTDKRHLFEPGGRIAKQLVILNDRRVPQTVRWTASLDGVQTNGEVRIAPGERALVPVAFTAPKKPGSYVLSAAFDFDGDSSSADRFEMNVVPPKKAGKMHPALYDPVGQTAAELTRLGIAFSPLAAPSNPPGRAARLVIGRGCLTPAVFKDLVLAQTRAGGRAVVFEQEKDALEAIGFRVQTLGLRHVYPRFRTPSLDGFLDAAFLRDWAGTATLAPGYEPLKDVELGAGSDTFAGFRNTRVWRNGYRGAVASVIPEKPSYGDWCALADGGFDLQYAPLLAWRTGRGVVTFCQLDVTARTEPDPAAERLLCRLVTGPEDPLPPSRSAKPFGMMAYQTGLAPRGAWFINQDPDEDSKRLYLVSSGAGTPPADFFDNVKEGATALLLGLDAAETQAWSPVPLAVVSTNTCYFSRIANLPPELNGLSNADWAWHGAMDFAAFTEPSRDGNAAFRIVRYGKGRLVFWQVPPWKIDAEMRPYLRTSKRRAEAMLSRLMGNLGFHRALDRILYADVPVATDDPYRYFHW